MSSINLILGSHNNQILDLPNADQETQYEFAIKPFLKLLYNQRDVRFTLYYSGLLIEWLDRHHSEFVDVLTEMVKRKQVELLGGAFYEPLLPMIPKTDRIGQIERMTTYLRKCFGRRPRGAWIPEGIWDQRIAASLNTGGLDYVMLRASTFPTESGKPRFRMVLTEDQGKILTVLPIAYRMSETMFDRSPEDMITFLANLRDTAPERGARPEPPPVVALMFDGSRLGYNQEQTDHCIQWYTRFLDLVRANRTWIHVDTPGRLVHTVRATDRCYARESTLESLMAWMPDQVSAGGPREKKSRGRTYPGSFRSVMEIYPESARLYSRMQHTHLMVNQIRGDKYRKITAREELWRGQSNYAYWHNRSGGIYRSSLRKATYGALIEAEKSTRERGIFIPAVSRIDVDLDGREEVLYQGNEINAYLHRHGARLFELDYIPRNWNYLDTFQRRQEPFHDDATIAAGYDSWPRSGFVDHLLVPDHAQEDFARGKRRQLCDISGLEYEIRSLDKEHSAVTFLGHCATDTGGSTMEIKKTYRFIKNRIEVEYSVVNHGRSSIHAVFAVELNLSFHSLHVDSLRLHARQGRTRQELTPDMRELEGVSDLQFLDLRNNTRVQISPGDRPDLWSFPVEAVGYLGDRLHWFYQSNCAVFRWPLALKTGETRHFSLAVKLEQNR